MTDPPATTGRRRERERLGRARFILERARELFAAKGVDATSMDDIAAASDYTRRTLYSYFASRDDICLQVHVEDLEKRWREQEQALDPESTGLEAILAWAGALLAYWTRNPHAMALERYWDYRGVDPARLDPAVFAHFRSLNEELADGLRRLFRRGVADGSLRPDLEIDVAISHFLYSLRAVLARALSTTHSFAPIEPDENVHHFLDLFARGVRGDGGGS